MYAKINYSRYRTFYDSMYSCIHVHELVQPYPFFQLALSVCTTTNVVQYFRKRYRNLDEFAIFTPSEFDCIAPYVCAYMMLDSLFLDMPISRASFDSQFKRWMRTTAPTYDYLCDNLDIMASDVLHIFFNSLRFA